MKTLFALSMLAWVAPALTPSAQAVTHTGEIFATDLHGQVLTRFYKAPSDDADRTVVYYFPKSVRNVRAGAKPRKTLFFLHGGGFDTADDASATAQGISRIESFIPYAEENKVILIFPTSAYGWNAHTSYFLRHLVRDCQAQLAIDDDHMVLAGQSMGGMGISREYPWLTDLFSGFLGMSSGTQPSMVKENLLLPYLNGTPYIQMNPKDDEHFADFDDLMRKFKTELEAVETKYGRTATFELVFREGGHNFAPHMEKVETQLDRLFQVPKNRFPKFFLSRLDRVNRVATTAQLSKTETDAAGVKTTVTKTAIVPKVEAQVDETFWIQVKNFKNETPPAPPSSERLLLLVEVQGQEIRLTRREDTLKPAVALLDLNSRLIRMNQPVTVTVDGKVVFHGKVSRRTKLSVPLDASSP
ncbi:MAG: hypothetical protein JNL01_13415 [Bdellovibrionales bacterium]|nr:hypothetical protein [Bdellovibrionales bacterium]